MKVICDHIDKCVILNGYHKDLCNHSQPHDKYSGCQENLCGLMGRNNINKQVKYTSHRKLKLTKINEKSNLS